jgi:hypothetical protein
MEDRTGRHAACGPQPRLCTSIHHGFRQGSPRLGRRCQHNVAATSRRATHDTTYRRCATAGRPAPSAKSTGSSSTTQLPWRAFGLGSSVIGGIAAAYYSHPLVGQAIIISGVAAAMITVATALFGSVTTSERAFRLLRWLANRPEPDAPPTEIPRATRRSSRRRSGSRVPSSPQFASSNCRARVAARYSRQ